MRAIFTQRRGLLTAALLGWAAGAFGAQGDAMGPDFEVKGITAFGALPETRVLSDANGNFVVIYPAPVPGPDEHLFGQRFDRFGGKVGWPMDLGLHQPPPPNGVTRNELAMDEQGNLLRVVAQPVPGTQRVRLLARIHANTLKLRRVVPLFEIAVDSQLRKLGRGGSREFEDWIPTADVTELSYAVAVDADGDFVVTYGQRVTGGGGQPIRSHIFARRFDRDGARVGSPIQVSQDESLDHLVSLVDMDRKGNFVVGWRQRKPITECGSWGCLSYDLYPAAARRFNRFGRPLTPIVDAGSDCSTRFYVGPEVALDVDGDFVVAFQQEEDCIVFGGGNEPFTRMSIFDAVGNLRREFSQWELEPGRYLQFVAPHVAALSTASGSDPFGFLRFFDVGYGDAPRGYDSLLFGYEDPDGPFPNSFLHDFAGYGKGNLILGWSRGLDSDPNSDGPRIFTLTRLLGPGGLACWGAAATIIGSNGPDRIVGTERDDVIHALGGNDVVDARGGDDAVCAGNGDDLVLGGDGADRIYGGLGRDELSGGAGDDVLRGAEDNDVLNGNAGNDKLFGDAGDDVLHGGPGTDVANGGPGSDVCDGAEIVSHCP